MRALYFNPELEETVELTVEGVQQVAELLRTASLLRSPRGRPTLEIQRDDGSTLSISGDGLRAFLVWVDPLGRSHHTTGGGDGARLIFDYFGSWSEAPADQLIAMTEALASAEAFVVSGSPSTSAVAFQPE